MLLRLLKRYTLICAVTLAACAPAATPTSLPPVVATSAPAVEATPTVPPLEAQPTAESPTASPTELPAPTAPVAISAAFVKGEVLPTGSFTLDPASGVLALSDDFRVAEGPDLYVVLSGASDVTLDFQTFSQQVLSTPKLDVGKLKSFSSAQQYQLPAAIDLAQYHSVVIWCQTYSVAFIMAPLQP